LAHGSSFSQDAKSISKVPKSTLPLICIRDGSPPLPDVLNSSLIELGKRETDRIVLVYPHEALFSKRRKKKK